MSPTSFDASLAGDTTPVVLSKARRYALLFCFSAANYFDSFGSSSTTIALSRISNDLGLSSAEASWIINSYTLSLAAFLLAAGRLSDITSARIVFIGGLLVLGAFSLSIGFSKDKVTLIVLRAFSGIGASATIPAALNLISHLFEDERERAVAYSVFAALGAFANVSGGLVGAVLLLADWRWIFWVVTIVTFPLALVSWLLIPKETADRSSPRVPVDAADSKEVSDGDISPPSTVPKLDYLGTALLLAAIVLLVFGVSNGNVEGWARASTFAPLVVGVITLPAFFYWQTRMPRADALIDPAIWRIPNVVLLAIVALVPYFDFLMVQTAFSDHIQIDWRESPLLAAVRILPMGISSFVVMLWNQHLPRRLALRWRLVGGATISVAGSALLTQASRSSDYWRFGLPGFLLMSAGTSLVYVATNIAFMLSVPVQASGVAGGIFNTSLQLGISIFLAVVTTIQISFPSSTEPAHVSWKGFANSLWFGVGLMGVVPILVLLLFREPKVEDEVVNGAVVRRVVVSH